MAEDWWFPTAQDLANKAIRIENTGLRQVFMTMPTEIETGRGIGNIKRIQLDLDVDKNGCWSIKAKVTLYDMTQTKLQHRKVIEEVELDNPELLLDVEVAEIQMRWKAES